MIAIAARSPVQGLRGLQARARRLRHSQQEHAGKLHHYAIQPPPLLIDDGQSRTTSRQPGRVSSTKEKLSRILLTRLPPSRLAWLFAFVIRRKCFSATISHDYKVKAHRSGFTMLYSNGTVISACQADVSDTQRLNRDDLS